MKKVKIDLEKLQNDILELMPEKEPCAYNLGLRTAYKRVLELLKQYEEL